MSQQTLEQPKVRTNHDGDHERFAHIVKKKPGYHSADAMITEARVMGTPVEALCGKVWIPSRDPKNYPICPECEEIAIKIQKGKR